MDVQNSGLSKPGSVSSAPGSGFGSKLESAPDVSRQKESFEQLYNQPEENEAAQAAGQGKTEDLSSIFKDRLVGREGPETALSPEEPGLSQDLDAGPGKAGDLAGSLKDSPDSPPGGLKDSPDSPAGSLKDSPADRASEKPGQNPFSGQSGQDEEKIAADPGNTADWPVGLAGHPFGPGGTETVPAVQAAPAVPEAGRDLGLDLERLVDRILVSDPAQGGPQEVRLTFSDSVLAGTEALVSRGPDGLLSVIFNSVDPGSVQTLVAAQSSLKEALDRINDGGVRLTINLVGSSDSGSSQGRPAGRDGGGRGDARNRAGSAPKERQ
ncbi:MAG: hypothetical protein LBP22_16410 [Deltaproteobacteria bacterium]|jgi:type III secretion system needle length determinant|nr:hypothetical protein [Deltaproteobacteria bacterium]